MIEDHYRLEQKGVTSLDLYWLNTEDPDIPYLANGLQYWLTGSYEFVYHPGTPIILINSYVADILYRTRADAMPKEDFVRELLRNPYPYVILCRMVSVLVSIILLILVYCLVSSFSESNSLGPWVAVCIVVSILLFRQYWLKISPRFSKA